MRTSIRGPDQRINEFQDVEFLVGSMLYSQRERATVGDYEGHNPEPAAE